MRREIENWKKSKKYAEFKKMQEAKKQQILDLKLKFMKKEYDDDRLTKKELIEYMRLIIASSELEDDDVSEFEIDIFSAIGTQEDIMLEYIQRQYSWFNYLDDYLKAEDYETCSLIRDVINLNESTIIKNIKQYGVNFEGPYEEFFDKIKRVNTRFYNTISNKKNDN